jgi:hypothetical protein
MGYEFNITDCSLTKTKSFFIHLDDMDDGWYFLDTELHYKDNWFQSNSEVIADLEHFRDCGVRGHFIVFGECGEWIKYVLDDNCVTEYNASLVWGDELVAPIKFTSEDVQEQSDGMFTKEEVELCMKDKKMVQRILDELANDIDCLSWQEVLQDIIEKVFNAKLKILA